MYQRVTLAAGVAVEFQEASDFFRMLEGAQADASVIFYSQGKEVSRAENIGEGYSERFSVGGFDKVRLESAAGGVFEFVTRLGNQVDYSKAPTGDVNILNLPADQGAFYQERATIGNGGSTQIRPAKADRRFLFVQNNDPIAVMRVMLGAAASASIGVRLQPGEHFKIEGFCSNQSVNCILETAAGAASYNCDFIEG